MSTEITPDSRIMVVSGDGIMSRDVFDAMLRSHNLRMCAAPVRTNEQVREQAEADAERTERTERERWNDEVEARKSAKLAKKGKA